MHATHGHHSVPRIRSSNIFVTGVPRSLSQLSHTTNYAFQKQVYMKRTAMQICI